MTFPLTQFLIDMLANRLPSHDPSAIAAHYGVSVDHVAGYLGMRG